MSAQPAGSAAGWVCLFDGCRPAKPERFAALEDALQENSAAAMVVFTPAVSAPTVVDLAADPEHVVTDAAAVFVPAPAAGAQELVVDPNLPAGFRNLHLMARHLLAAPAPVVVLMPDPEPGASSVSDLLDPRRYTVTARRGYLDLLTRPRRADGPVPTWVQTWVLHDLAPLFAVHDQSAEAQTAGHGAVAEEFLAALGEIARLLDPEVVTNFRSAPFRPEWRDLLLHGFDPGPWHSSFAVAGRRDRQQRLTRVTYRYTGPLPAERFTRKGTEVAPVYGKLRALPYFERTTLWERIVWLPSGALECTLDGHPVEVRTSEPRPPARTPNRPPTAPALSRQDRLAVALARSRWIRRRFGKAWVLMDRVHDADDSAEHLFRYLRSEHPRTNAWFVIEKDTADYRRLRADGVRRIVPYGSFAWKLLLLNCEHLISSHADGAIVRPPAVMPLVKKRPWRVTFLNHGVIKDDLSLWLNPADLDLFVTSTPGEYASVAGDGTTYRYTAKETVLSGMPRFDRVLAAGQRIPPEERQLILISPTWRRWLVASAASGTQRFGATDGLLDSEFVREWTALLGDPALLALADKHALTVATLFHPNLQPFVPRLDLPAHVQNHRFEGVDVRELFARARVLVTDYSSMAFNAAYIERPVVYFQFDRDRMMQGGHFGRQGYFDYERDGYGPVALQRDAALRAVCEMVEAGPEPVEPYLSRIRAAFPARDGQCSERVYRAIADSTRRADRQPAR